MLETPHRRKRISWTRGSNQRMSLDSRLICRRARTLILVKNKSQAAIWRQEENLPPITMISSWRSPSMINRSTHSATPMPSVPLPCWSHRPLMSLHLTLIASRGSGRTRNQSKRALKRWPTSKALLILRAHYFVQLKQTMTSYSASTRCQRMLTYRDRRLRLCRRVRGMWRRRFRLFTRRTTSSILTKMVASRELSNINRLLSRNLFRLKPLDVFKKFHFLTTLTWIRT